MRVFYGVLRRACYGLAILASSQGLFGQQVLLNENFAGFPSGSPALPYQGWVNNIITGNSGVDQWIFDDPAFRGASSPISSPYAIFDSDWNSNSYGAENVALESPSFSTTGFGTVTLKFDQYFDGIYNSTDSIVVEVNDGSTWHRVYSYNGYGSITNSQNIDVSAFIANVSSAKVRFRFVGDWSFYWIVDNVKVEGYFTEDAATLKAGFTSGNCGSTDDSISVDIANAGLNSISNFDIKAQITGTLGGNPVNTTITQTYTGTLTSGQKASVMLPGINTASSGIVSLIVWTELSGEQNTSNDSAYLINLNFLGIPSAPTANNGQRCGQGSVTLQAGNVTSGDSIIWFDGSGAQQLGMGVNFQTPPTAPGNYSYMVAAGRGAGADRLQTTFAAGNGQSGVMFDVTPAKNISVDSFEVSFDQSTEVVEVYYKEGSYFGFETTPTAWTFVGSTTVTSTLPNGGPGIYVNVGQSINMEVGKTYAIYIQLPNSTAINYTDGSYVYSNPDMTINTGVGKAANFGGTYAPRSFNGALHYSYISCLSPKTSVQVQVDPLPAGVDVIQGSPFQGTHSIGNMANPHIVADGDNIVFELTPPSAYNNASFGIDWIISDLQITTLSGNQIPTGDTTTSFPTAQDNAELSITPSISLSDSILKIVTTVTSLQTGCDTVLEEYVFVAPRPVAAFSFNPVCDGDELTFTNNTSILSGNVSYSWDLGDGTTSNLEEPSHTYPATGNYTVVLTATSDLGYVDQITQTVNVKPVPETDFSFTNACEGSDITLTNTTLMPPGTPSFHWDFDDGNSSTTQNTAHQYAAPGYYNVTYTVEVNGCSNSITKGVTQAPMPSPNFSYTSFCNNSEAVFSNSSSVLFGSMGYRWKFGDGNNSTSQDVSHDYAGFGNFDVTLVTTTNFGCVDSVSKQISLTEAPEISISFNSPCVGQAVDFVNNSVQPSGGSNSYDWDFGDGTTSTQENPSHIYPAIGTYEVYVRSSHPNGCLDSFTTFITINEKPIAGIVVPDVVCDGDEVNFLNSTGTSMPNSVTYGWDFGNGVTSMSKDTSFTYAGPGSYDVVMIAGMPGGCADTAMATVRVSELPSAGFTFSSAQSGDGSFRFLADETGSGISYQWFFGDGGKATTQDPLYPYRYDGRFKVRLIVTNADGCFSESTQNVDVVRTGIGQVDATGIQLYPNPNTGSFTLNLNESADHYRISVLNSLGQQVEWKRSNLNDRQVEMNLTDVTPGVYYVRLQGENGEVHTLRFTVQ